MADKLKVGWIGLGKMGLPMAENVIKGGFPMKVYNRTAAKAKPLADKGAEIVDSPKAAGSDVDVIISMIADDTALVDVSCGPDGCFQTAKSGAIYIDMSTVSPTICHSRRRGRQEGDQVPARSGLRLDGSGRGRHPDHSLLRPQGRF